MSSAFLLQIREQTIRAEGGSLKDQREGKLSPASSSPYSAGSLPGFIPVITLLWPCMSMCLHSCTYHIGSEGILTQDLSVTMPVRPFRTRYTHECKHQEHVLYERAG